MTDNTPNTNSHTTNIIIAKPEKSVIATFFLTLLFGPLGLLYASIGGGIFMTICAIILVPITGGLAAILIWPITIIWGVIAAMTSKAGSKSRN